MKDRAQMDAALKRIVIPELRRVGFTGSYPHLRRISDAVDLITFQFDQDGGGFVVEVARGLLTGYKTYWGKLIEAKKLRAWDLHPNLRARLQPSSGGGTNNWFRYDGFRGCETVAKSALDMILKHNWSAQPMAGDYRLEDKAKSQR